jgi:hypothetical protein
MPASWGRREAAARLDEDRHDLAPAPLLELEPGAERAALDQFHGDKDVPRDFTDLVDGDDIRVREAGERLGLVAQVGPAHAVLGEGAAQELERDLATELLVLGGEDEAHPALVELAEDREVADACAGLAEEVRLEEGVIVQDRRRGWSGWGLGWRGARGSGLV